jgi:diguanylate cyclase (GGDEF)-like protein
VTDVLTRVHNRRYFEDRLAGEMSFALRHAAPLSLLLFDVDHFKKVNDTFGHAAGDAVLRVMAATVKRMVRTEDLVARYGGEEFAVIARGIGHRNAMIFGERVRKTVQACVVPWDERPIHATISIGVATVEQGSPIDGTRALVAAADAALYRAKNGGRNRVAD